VEVVRAVFEEGQRWRPRGPNQVKGEVAAINFAKYSILLFLDFYTKIPISITKLAYIEDKDLKPTHTS
jgi:hypothetical protein